ncbi:MAG: hypothetical protein ABS41_09570 [Arenimonas sp. SCN 70-307]|uniref:FKBP-type peptidyl-prolyl cis-trans isomerase N-terminal domain-containing protein n=1 Tax=Arenimonas sp. SCN 70-307 TaxID=1660089 RepID=UPI00086B4F71|nr:FKBP-type peptidyl-prolyl cis-trans isomerase N-terminal domain-containing protein [Arenimonas sp. SCN 70-307]ODS62475.1 MAG: hypothetical protein ABS41_09570 [Arenimonas sp. SCN 70-307]
MRLRHPLLAAFVALALSGGATAQDTTSEKGKLSYALGYSTGQDMARLIKRGEQFDMATFMKAVQDATAGKEPVVPRDQLQVAVDSMQRREMARAKAEFDKVSADNKTRSEAFLARNRGTPGVQVLPSGLQYRVIEAGSGPRPTQASEVQVQYKTTTPDGQVIADTGQPMAGQPAGPLTIRISEVQMPGLREALLSMPAGSRWEVVLPANLAAGTDQDAGRLVNQALVFDLRLLSVSP